MLKQARNTIAQFHMFPRGAKIIVGLSGGADSVALLFALYLLKEKLEIRLEAAHFNHNLRGGESGRSSVRRRRAGRPTGPSLLLIGQL